MGSHGAWTMRRQRSRRGWSRALGARLFRVHEAQPPQVLALRLAMVRAALPSLSLPCTVRE